MPRSTSVDRKMPPKMPSQIQVPGIDGDNHDDSFERVRRSSSEKDQLPAQYNRFDKSILQQDSHGGDSRRSSQNDQLPAKFTRFNSSGLQEEYHNSDSRRSSSQKDSRNSDSFGSSNNSGSLRGNRTETSKQVKSNRDNDLRSLAELGLELQEERSGDGGSDVANVEPSSRPSNKRNGDGDGALANDSGRNFDIDLNSVETKAIIKL